MPEEEPQPEAEATQEEPEAKGKEGSLYNFNLDEPDSVERIMSLLPVLDPEIIQSLYQECFPGYPVDDLAPRMARIELKGFFKDYLEGSVVES